MLILLIFTWHSWIWFWVSEVVCDWAIETVVVIEVTGTSASIGWKLFPKGIVPQVWCDRAETACPRYYGTNWGIGSIQTVTVLQLSYFCSLVHHSIHELENLALVYQLSQTICDFIPCTKPIRSSFCKDAAHRVICKGAIARCKAFYWRHFYQSTL